MKDAEEIAGIAVSLRKEKRFDEAKKILRDAIRDDDKAWQLWTQLGHVLVGTGDYSDAATAFENATKLNPNGFWLWLSLGYTRKELNQIDGAISATLKATELGSQPSEVGSALYNLGCYTCLAGKHDEAIEYLDKAFKLDSSIRDWAREDSDLISLKSDERFTKLMTDE
ncbi:MAG: TPR end-of-group domain-containing protein [Candidatus Thorarchaeota archaeon]|jgi:tetratricopeptide (TPR) repeat protein